MKALLLLIIFIISCETNQQNETNYLFYINEEDNLSIDEMTNKIAAPCGSPNNFPPLKQLPGNTLNYLSAKDIGINFDCDKSEDIYPMGEGVVIDIIEDKLDLKMLDHYQKLVEVVGYLPYDVRQMYYRKHIIIDHGKYFNKKYRTIAIYTNLREVPDAIQIGSIVAGRSAIGKINTSEIDFLTSFTGFSKEDSTKIVVKENVLNVDIFFEKDEITKYHLGQGISVDVNNFKEFFYYPQ